MIKLIKIPKINDDCFLHFVENNKHIPFATKRVYYITQPNADLYRGKHAHYQNKQVIFCIQGKVKMVIDDGNKKEVVVLDKSEVGLFLDKMIWHEMHDMNKNTILLVFASKFYDENDYIRDYNDFLKIANTK